MRVKDAVGRFGEAVACRHLEAGGLQILERNWRCPEGEIDIVALDGDELVIVEVKTRSTSAFGSPAEAVGHAKAARLRRLAVRWMQQHRECAGPGADVPREWGSVRIDVVAVVRARHGEPDIEHFVGAI